MKTIISIVFFTFSLLVFGKIVKDTNSYPQLAGLRLSYTSSDLQYIDIGVGLDSLIPVREMIGPLGYP